MASKHSQSFILPLQILFFASLLSSTPSSAANSNNIQTFFPSIPSPAFVNFPQPPTPSPTFSFVPKSSNNSKLIIKTVVGTAVGSFGLSALLFLAFLFFTARKREPNPIHSSKPNSRTSNHVFDENVLEVPRYWSDLDRCPHCNKSLVVSHQGSSTDSQQHQEQPETISEPTSPVREGGRIQETPLLPASSIRSTSNIIHGSLSSSDRISTSSTISAHAVDAVARNSSKASSAASKQSVSPMPINNSAPQVPTVMNYNAVPAAPPPPPPLPPRLTVAGGVVPAAPPPPPPTSASRQSSSTLSRPPPAPMMALSEAGPKKMRPLHWDKLNPSEIGHSVVWNRMSGSFQFDEDIMEALFGTVATNKRNSKATNTNVSSFASASSTTNNQAQICLLDPRKSQNIAIVLRSLSLSRHEVLSALEEGHGLTIDILEKLTKIAPTKDEEALIASYTGNPTKLADAESFLFHILRTVPTPFARLDAMLFKYNYEPEVKHQKQSLKTLELACNELKNRGVFLKLLEAVLKAGNRMNAGTSRGNAQAFNLSALNKLADVKSTDGSTTLLHFVVQEVVRSEGKRLVLNRNYSLRRSESSSSSGSVSAKLDGAGSRSEQREERDFEYMKYGLPIVGGLSSEFSNVKKAASIDYEMLLGTCSSLGARVEELKRFLVTCGNDGFVIEMKIFVQRADEDLKLVKEEQDSVLEQVKRITAYYQPGASNDKGAQPLMLFVIVGDFLDMVDKACIGIAKDQQQKKTKQMQAVGSNSKSGMKPPEVLQRVSRPVIKFPNLPVHFMSDNSHSDSGSDEENS